MRLAVGAFACPSEPFRMKSYTHDERVSRVRDLLRLPTAELTACRRAPLCRRRNAHQKREPNGREQVNRAPRENVCTKVKGVRSKIIIK